MGAGIDTIPVQTLMPFHGAKLRKHALQRRPNNLLWYFGVLFEEDTATGSAQMDVQKRLGCLGC